MGGRSGRGEKATKGGKIYALPNQYQNPVSATKVFNVTGALPTAPCVRKSALI